jgi:lipopolysaccharide export system permease protein
MKTILKYILRQWMGNFLLTFIILNIIMMIGNIVKYSSSKGFLIVLPMIPYFLPAVFIYTLPLSGLISTITTISRIRNKKETVTLASSGVSISQILYPFIMIGLFLCVFTTICFQWLQPMADKGKQNYLANMGASLLENELQKDHAVIEIDNNTIYSFKNQNKRSVILQKRKNGTIIDEVFADNAEIRVNRIEKRIELETKSMTLLEYDNKSQNYMTSVIKIYDLPLIKLPYPETYSKKGSYRHMELSLMWNELNDISKPFNKVLASYFYEKISILFSPILLVLAAFPLSFIGSADGKTPGFLFGLAMVFLCYYPLLIYGKDLSLNSKIIPIWLCLQIPNIFLIIFSSLGLMRLNQKV